MKQNKLFYGSMQAHERAYKDQRAEEAKNDMILGAQVNSLVQMEEAKERNVNDIATRYGAFLKALKAKDILLKNDATKKENDIANNPGLVVSGVVDIPSSNVLFTGKSAERARKGALEASLKEAEEILNRPGINAIKYDDIVKILGKPYKEAIDDITTSKTPSKPSMQKAINMIKTKNMIA